MQKIITAAAIGVMSFFLLTAGKCGADACATETYLHQAYQFAAPLLGRTAEQQAFEQSAYAFVMNLCAKNASPSQIEVAQSKSAAARQ